jgi:hypothetical protein
MFKQKNLIRFVAQNTICAEKFLEVDFNEQNCYQGIVGMLVCSNAYRSDSTAFFL